jgi:hypothetical protein
VAAWIDDEPMRRSFLEHVEEHACLLAWARGADPGRYP